MKIMYACEKCGLQADDYRKVYDCEQGHVSPFPYDPCMDEFTKYGEGVSIAKEGALAVDWDYETDENGAPYRIIESAVFVVVKGMMDDDTLARLNKRFRDEAVAAHEERQEKA